MTQRTRGLACAGVRDTSRQGRYHNARFKTLAKELGLEVRRDPLIGWSVTTPAADTASGMLGCSCGDCLRAGRRGMPGLRAATCGICGARLRELTGSRTA